MSKLSQYPSLPITIRLTETGQELTFSANPKGDKLHVSGNVGPETYEGFIVVEPVSTAHPDMRWDVRVSLCIPKESESATPAKTVKTRKAEVVTPVAVDVDGAPATEEKIEFTDNERFLLKDIQVDPIEQTRDILDAMPDATKAPSPGEEEALEKLAWEIRAEAPSQVEEEAIPQEEYIESTTPPAIGEEEEREEKLVAKAAARNRRPKQA